MNVTRRLLFVTLLTCVRIPLVFIFFAGALADSLTNRLHPSLFYAAFACLVVATVTDMLDGYYARKLGVTTKLGACADPLSDKVFYLTTLPLLVFLATRNTHIIHAVVLLCLTISLLLRDQWVSFLRSVGASCENVNLGANWSGKLRTAINFPLICLIYYREGTDNPYIGAALLYVLEAGALVMNFVSFVIYTRQYWPHLKKSMAITPPQ